MTRRSVTVFDTKGEQVKRQEIESNLQYDAGDKGAYRHYMQKEIYEQPNAIKNTLTGRISHGEVDLSELGANANELLSKVEHIQIVACVPLITPVWSRATGLNPWRACRVMWKSRLSSAIENLRCVVTA